MARGTMRTLRDIRTAASPRPWPSGVALSIEQLTRPIGADNAIDTARPPDPSRQSALRIECVRDRAHWAALVQRGWRLSWLTAKLVSLALEFEFGFAHFGP